MSFIANWASTAKLLIIHERKIDAKWHLIVRIHFNGVRVRASRHCLHQIQWVYTSTHTVCPPPSRFDPRLFERFPLRNVQSIYDKLITWILNSSSKSCVHNEKGSSVLCAWVCVCVCECIWMTPHRCLTIQNWCDIRDSREFWINNVFQQQTVCSVLSCLSSIHANDIIINYRCHISCLWTLALSQ